MQNKNLKITFTCYSVSQFKFGAGGIENQKIKVTRTKELRKVLYTTELLDSSSQRSKVLQSLFVIRLNPVDMSLHLIQGPGAVLCGHSGSLQCGGRLTFVSVTTWLMGIFP